MEFNWTMLTSCMCILWRVTLKYPVNSMNAYMRFETKNPYNLDGKTAFSPFVLTALPDHVKKVSLLTLRELLQPRSHKKHRIFLSTLHSIMRMQFTRMAGLQEDALSSSNSLLALVLIASKARPFFCFVTLIILPNV